MCCSVVWNRLPLKTVQGANITIWQIQTQGATNSWWMLVVVLLAGLICFLQPGGAFFFLSFKMNALGGRKLWVNYWNWPIVINSSYKDDQLFHTTHTFDFSLTGKPSMCLLESYREEETVKEIFYLLVHSPVPSNSWTWARAQAWSQEPETLLINHVGGKNPGSWAITSCCLGRALAGNLIVGAK